MNEGDEVTGDIDDTPGPDDVSDVYDLDGLLGAYALDAVDADEQRRVEDYLRVNPRAAAEVQQHREVATMLAFTGMDAPDGVWSRIEDQIESTAPEPGPELAKVLKLDETERVRRRPIGSWVLAGAAAIALLVAGFVVFADRNSGSDDLVADALADAVDDPSSIRADLVADGSSSSALGVIDGDGHGFVDASGLPALDADQTYQLWGVLAETGDVVSIGILGADPAIETFTVDGEVTALALTIEDSPGVVSDGNPDGAYVGAFG